MIASGVAIVPSQHTFLSRENPIRYQPSSAVGITIGSGVWIGVKATVLDGVAIGEGCVIGAGSVVTKNIPPYTVAVGVPARVIRERP